ncbi:transcriptional regulator GcvA [Elongatibacter sediminis]|uniref:Transcriptional regulator GcvA n=1 Tax=Elongatibacter sediminis TaxID=3119006 RepID=A0AAW9RD68_9GAMM
MPNVTLNALRTFEAVASRLSFAKGAEFLNVSPAAVSSQVRSLEEQLGQPLFYRKGRQITLTEAGRKLLPGVQHGLAELRRAVRLVEQERSEGVLNVTMMPTFLQKWMLPRLAGFSDTHEQIDLRIQADNGLTSFEDSDVHAAIRFGAGQWPGVRATHLLDDWILPVCSPRLLERIGPIESAEQLLEHDLLYVESTVWDAWFRVIGQKSRESRWALLNDSLSILIAAEQDQGIALTRWSLVARDIAAGRLVRPIPTVVQTDWSYYFVAPPEYFELPKVAMFRAWLESACAEFEKPQVDYTSPETNKENPT